MQFVIYSNGEGSMRYNDLRRMSSKDTVTETLSECRALEKSGEWGLEIHVAGSIWNYSEAAAMCQLQILREQLENRYEVRLRRKP